LVEKSISSVCAGTTRRFHHSKNTFQIEIIKDPMAIQLNRRIILGRKEYF
jgi:hypothetical protein